MSAFTQQEVDELYANIGRRVSRQDNTPHDEQEISHQMITFWEGIIWLRDTLYDPDTHLGTEDIIKDRGAFLKDLTEEKVLLDPEAAFKRLWIAIGNVMHRKLFPEEYEA